MPSQYGRKVDRFYRSAKWKRVRSYVIAMAHGRCQMCGCFVGDSGHVHHRIPVTDENCDLPIAIDPNNLMLLCESCHDAIRHQDSAKATKVRFDANGEVILFDDSKRS